MARKAKRFICAVLSLLCFNLTGCWNYRGLNEMNIVTGIAIDADDSGQGYRLTFEIIDLAASTKEEGIKPTLVDSRGSTIFEAMRNAKKKLANKIYFGSTEVFVINQEVARKKGFSPIIDFLMRDAEPRQSVVVAVSREQTAKQLLMSDGLDEQIVSFKITQITEEDPEVTGTSIDTRLKDICSIIKDQGKDLVLPAFRLTKSLDSLLPEIDGTAVFSSQKLAGFLTPEETRYYLMATNELKGGIFPLHSREGYRFDATLELSSVNTSYDLKWEQDQLTVICKPKISVFLAEFITDATTAEKLDYTRVRGYAEKLIADNINWVIKKTQTEFGADIIGIGDIIHHRDNKRWNKIKGDWKNIYRTIRFVAQPKVVILNTAQIRGS